MKLITFIAFTIQIYIVGQETYRPEYFLFTKNVPSSTTVMPQMEMEFPKLV